MIVNKHTSTVLLCICINMLDGFDILSMSFSAPLIQMAWHVSPDSLGVLFSASLVGMMGGSLLLPFLADRFGRRALILSCLTLSAVGMLCSGCAGSLAPLVFSRVLTGVGVGGMMPTLNTLVAEAVTARHRNLAVVLQAAGYPIGGTIGGIFALRFAAGLGWHALFISGFVISAALLIGAWMGITESPSFLNERAARQRGAVSITPENLRSAAAESANRARFMLGPFPFQRRSGVALSVATFLVQFSFYFFLSWTPSLLKDAGLSTAGGISSAIWMNIGGIVADFAFAAAVIRAPPRSLGALCMIAAFVTAVTSSRLVEHRDLLFANSLLVGGFLFASMASIYAVAPTVFSAHVRSTGTGIAMAAGRFGGALGPLIGGELIATERQALSFIAFVLALPLVGGAWLIIYLRPKEHSSPRDGVL